MIRGSFDTKSDRSRKGAPTWGVGVRPGPVGRVSEGQRPTVVTKRIRRDGDSDFKIGNNYVRGRPPDWSLSSYNLDAYR